METNSHGGQVRSNRAEVYFQVKIKESNKMAEDVRCKKAEHNRHICALKAKGFDKKHSKEFKNLLKDPQYICANCRAKVEDKKSVCEPVPL